MKGFVLQSLLICIFVICSFLFLLLKNHTNAYTTFVEDYQLSNFSSWNFSLPNYSASFTTKAWYEENSYDLQHWSSEYCPRCKSVYDIPADARRSLILSEIYTSDSGVSTFIRSMRSVSLYTTIALFATDANLQNMNTFVRRLYGQCGIVLFSIGTINKPYSDSPYFFRFHLYYKFLTKFGSNFQSVLIANISNSYAQFDPFQVVIPSPFIYMSTSCYTFSEIESGKSILSIMKTNDPVWNDRRIITGDFIFGEANLIVSLITVILNGYRFDHNETEADYLALINRYFYDNIFEKSGLHVIIDDNEVNFANLNGCILSNSPDFENIKLVKGHNAFLTIMHNYGQFCQTLKFIKQNCPALPYITDRAYDEPKYNLCD